MKTGPSLLIRADAGSLIGVGHVMRCMALAEAWLDRGGRCTFAIAAGAASTEDRLHSDGMEVVRMQVQPGSESDALQTVELARRVGAVCVVADGYHFGTYYQRLVKDSGMSLAIVDDFGHADHYYADLVLNQNLHAHDSLYASREQQTELLLGTRYALLRREFSGRRDRGKLISERGRKVLVTLGGSDSANLTLVVIRALSQLSAIGIEATIVVGPANPHLEAIRCENERLAGSLDIVTNVEDMSSLMAWSDVAVSAAGSTCWELAFMGVPMVTITLAENQREIARSLTGAGVALAAGWHTEASEARLAELVSELIHRPDLRNQMSQAGQSLIDGEGASRVAGILQGRVSGAGSAPRSKVTRCA